MIHFAHVMIHATVTQALLPPLLLLWDTGPSSQVRAAPLWQISSTVASGETNAQMPTGLENLQERCASAKAVCISRCKLRGAGGEGGVSRQQEVSSLFRPLIKRKFSSVISNCGKYKTLCYLTFPLLSRERDSNGGYLICKVDHWV